jgi:amino acid adenylation domain-containing protein
MNNPTTQQPPALANLTVAEKRELLKNFLSLRNGAAQHVLPLSFGQQSLWVVYQLAPQSPAYNFLYAARIKSKLDEDALVCACQALAQRHPPLRSIFRLEEGKAVQRILPQLRLTVPITPAQAWSEAELIAHMRDLADRPFDLEHGPALRIHLYRRRDEHVLLLVFHHMIADLWSMDILVEELQHIYHAERTGQRAELPAPAAQFADFVRWQFANVYGPRGQKAWEYWQEQLAGELPVLQLPTDHPRPAVQSYNGNAHNWALAEDTATRLRGLARMHGATLFVPLLTAFEILLHRLSGQKEFLVGTAVADRARPEWERLVGYFINQVALRARLDGGATFAGLVDQTRDKIHQALAHQDYPFGLIVKRLGPKRDPSHPPIFQVMFIWDKARELSASGQGFKKGTVPFTQFANVGSGHEKGDCPLFESPVHMESLLMEQRGAPFDLTLIIFEIGDKLTASFRYNSDLFDEATIVRLAGNFNALLKILLDQPNTPMAELALPTAEEQRVLLEDWNRTARPYPDHGCFHKLVERQAQAKTEALAVIFDKQFMTYGELNNRANRLARHLQSFGVGIGKHVGLCLPRSPSAIVAILATWKAGAAYVPLDPAYPRTRLNGMIEDARPAVIMSAENAPHRGLTPLGSPLADTGAKIINLDLIETELAHLPGSNLEPAARADDPAYIIFTSGSTGRPKGTVLCHRGLCNMSQAQVEVFRTEPHDRVLQFASLSFDASVFEMAMALRVGACLVLPTAAEQLPGEGLLRLLREQRVSNATLPPSVLAALPAADLPDLRTLIVAGEACSKELVLAWGKGRRFFNAYGPTETTVWATVAQCEPDGTTPSIGRPIANTRAYVLDEYLQPVPVGVPGELHIAGPGLALGYLNQPGLTAEKFIPDPFAPSDSGLMYKTGDLVRFRADGSLEFLGRRDHQVKVQGLRIELEEIQEALRRHPELAEAAVLAQKKKGLIAYVVPRNPGKTIEPTEIRAFLRECLPQFMVPAAVAVLDKFPLTISGKVDRAALPEVNGDFGCGTRSLTAPRNHGEEALAGIWARVLNVPKVGIHDNFFDLGGASIQTLEVAALAKEVGLSLAPELIFQYQTVAELAASGQWPAASGKEKTNGHSITNGKNKSHGSVPPATGHRPLATSVGNMVIESLGIYLPPRIVTTEEVVRNCRHPLNFPLERMTGIASRRMAGDKEFAMDLAAKAIEECLARSAYGPGDIDLLICTNISRCDGPEHRFSFEPTTSAQLQKRFGLKHALAFDIANACAGTFTALAIVESFLKQGWIRRALVVSGEYITHLTRTAQLEIENFMDQRIACLTLGDSGMALILEQAENDQVGFHELELYTLGKYHPLCVAKVTDRPHGGAIMYTDPVTSSAVTIKQAVSHSLGVLGRRGWLPDDVKHLILHQTSSTTLDGAIHEVNRVVGREVCSRANTVYNLAERANTATTTHFVALYDRLGQGKIAPGDKVLFGISGSGQTVGSALYTMDDLPSRMSAGARERGSAGRAPRSGAPRSGHFRLPRRVRVESIGLAGNARPDTVPLLRAAGSACLQQSAHSAGDMELVLHAGVYRSEFLLEPALAAITAGELGMNADDASLGERRTFAFDLANGGVGPLDACLVAGQMIAAGKIGAAMILASEVENNALSWPENQLGIQETASALILEPSAKDEGFASFWFQSFPELASLETYTRGWNNLLALAIERAGDLEQNYLACLAKAVHQFLKKEGVERDRIELVLPPLRSAAFVRRLADELRIPLGRFIVPQEKERDAFTSSLAQGLAAARKEGRCIPGTIGLVLAVGAGIQVGCALYYF